MSTAERTPSLASMSRQQRAQVVTQAIKGRPVGVIAKEYGLDPRDIEWEVQRCQTNAVLKAGAGQSVARGRHFEVRAWVTLDNLRRYRDAAAVRGVPFEQLVEDVVNLVAEDGMFDAVMDDRGGE